MAAYPAPEGVVEGGPGTVSKGPHRFDSPVDGGGTVTPFEGM